MAETYNVYLDESCHLENDGIGTMAIGAVWCSMDKTPEFARRVQETKLRHNLPPTFEIKWTKVSPAKGQFYRDLIDLFFDDDDLHFRGVVISDKNKLDHSRFAQDHHQWYYKMCFTLLEPILLPLSKYRIYLDIKDTHSCEKCRRLHEVLCNSRHDFGKQMIERVQPIRSEESPLLQVTDLLLGALNYHVRGLKTSATKRLLIERIRRRTNGWDLGQTTWLCETKFNILNWRSREELP